MGGRGSKADADALRGRQRKRHSQHHTKLLEEELKEEQTIITPPEPDDASPPPFPSSSPSPLTVSPTASPSPSPTPSPTLRRRVKSGTGAPAVSTRSYYYRHEVESSDSESSSSPPTPPHTPPRRYCEWLHRRHFFLLSVVSLLVAYYLSTLPPSEYFSDLPTLSAYLPDELQSSITRLQTLISDPTRPGTQAREEGIRAHFPVVLIPGIISTALEVWEGEACARPHFRQRLWGSSLMLRSILLDTRCWMRHMMLDSQTGMDPPGIKLRSSAGLEAADYLVGGFWVWAKLIHSLSDIGYDPNSMYMAAYDWRLSFKHLQVRDFYFTKLKAQIETAQLSNRNRKVVLVTHSMGALVVHYFLQWVQSEEGGKGGDRWVDGHIESIVNIGGPMLGVAKSWSALFSGEMKDTAELAPFLDYWRQRVVFSTADVIQIMRAMFSVPSMLPKGGNVIWGDEEGSPDDFFCKKYADVTRVLLSGGKELDGLDEEIVKEYCDGRIIPHFNRSTTWNEITDSSRSSLEEDEKQENVEKLKDKAAKDYAEGKLQSEPAGGIIASHSFADMLEDSILRHPSRWFTSHKAAQPYVSAKGSTRGSFVTFTSDHSTHEEGEEDECVKAGMCDMTLDEGMQLLRKTAPQYMNFTDSLYSFGAEPTTDHNDQRHWSNPLESPLPWAPDLKIFCFYGVGRETERGYMYRHVPAPSPSENHLVPHWSINSSHTDDEVNIRSGVKFTDGDGTVPLVSLGFMCSAGWRDPRLNPAGATVVTREYLEVNATMAILRAATSTDHVDIMGNSEIIKDLIRVVGVKRRKRSEEAGPADDEEIEQRMEQRKRDIEDENEGKKKEEKGPRTEEEKVKEDGAQQRQGKPERENQNTDEAGQHVGMIAAEEEGEWDYTYIAVKDRVLSCVREISAEALRRWLNRYGGMTETEVARRVQATTAQSATQDPYNVDDKGRRKVVFS